MKNLILLLFFTFILSLQAQQSDFKEIDFTNADRIANLHEGEDLINLPMLVHNLTYQLDTEVERFRAIYYWVSHNIKGEYSLISRNDRKRNTFKKDPERLRQWNDQFKKEVFKRLLFDKETLCTGYAYLIKKLANIAGLECEIIRGHSLINRSTIKSKDIPNHSWNAVKLDGKWYLCDATWSAGFTNVSTSLFEFDFDNAYFLMEPSEFAKSHKPIDSKWTLLDQNSKTNNFGRN